MGERRTPTDPPRIVLRRRLHRPARAPRGRPARAPRPLAGGVRADLAGPRLLPGYLHSAAESLDRAADLAAESAVLVHDNERRWRTFRTRVAAIVAAAAPEGHCLISTRRPSSARRLARPRRRAVAVEVAQQARKRRAAAAGTDVAVGPDQGEHSRPSPRAGAAGDRRGRAARPGRRRSTVDAPTAAPAPRRRGRRRRPIPPTGVTEQQVEAGRAQPLVQPSGPAVVLDDRPVGKAVARGVPPRRRGSPSSAIRLRPYRVHSPAISRKAGVGIDRPSASGTSRDARVRRNDPSGGRPHASRKKAASVSRRVQRLTGHRSSPYVSSSAEGAQPDATSASFQPRLTASCSPVFMPCAPAGL